jgi:hypothetical protein
MSDIAVFASRRCFGAFNEMQQLSSMRLADVPPSQANGLGIAGVDGAENHLLVGRVGVRIVCACD